MARNLLTALEIKTSTKAKLRDGEGLWLHTGKAGTRYWVFIYIRHGRRREMGLGSYGTGTGHVSLAAARVKADEVRTILGRGGDPFKDMAERQARIKPKTFGEVADEYIEAMTPKWTGAKTVVGWKQFAREFAKPIRKVPVAEVSTDDVLRVLKPLWHEKPAAAEKTLTRVRLVLDAAKARKLRDGDNPAQWKGLLDKLLAPQDALNRGHHAAMPYADVPAFMTKLRAVDAMGALALEFTILTAVRTSETRLATWSEFDLDAKVWTIPAKRMGKGKRQHRVPLCDRAVEIVREMQEKSLNDYVFPGIKAKKPISHQTMDYALKAVVEGYTVHGMRSTFRDWAAEETDHQSEIAEAALAHVVGDETERAYRRGDVLAKRRALMADWAAYCLGGV
ncbi:Prophage CP4-57 integrase [Ensifer psoraleae]|uniref:tyrosine-type recombinase/integrase n=1 Tax=Sinorhizobium psoraleae TaxID=520838 RepID=UPI001568B508|nr:site-specific integrase [Sinorhizobium psoraleae]NRP70590.1 Prophage CP4-57 integrase [Sinorhizobium psoraleae]